MSSRRRARRLAAALAATLAMLSCTAAPSAQPAGPTGTLGEVLKNARALIAPGVGATVPDPVFEAFLTDLDLSATFGARADEIADQLRKSRASAAAKRSSVVPSGRYASVVAVSGTFIVPEFAERLAASLDEFTKRSANVQSAPSSTASTEDGPTAVTSTSVAIDTAISSSGSTVTVTMHWAFHSASGNKTTGEREVDIVDDRTMVGKVNVCPDSQGQVIASVDVRSRFVATKKGTTTTRTATSSSVFTGHVDDSAALVTVSQVLTDHQEWETSGNSGSFDGTVSGTYASKSDALVLGDMDAGSVSGSFTGKGDGLDKVGKLAGWDMALDAYALSATYQSAQKLWRNGRCVVIQAPDYNAETPIEVADQEKQQHDEQVDVGSETKFAVNLKGRFGGALTQPATAALSSGDKTLEPNKLDSGSGSLTYKAPDDEDKHATAILRTTSKRGIGTLVLAFNTSGATLSLQIKGTLRFTSSILTYEGPVSIGPAEFKKRDGNVSAVVAPATTTLRLTSGLPFACEITATGAGTVGLSATAEKRGQDSVWVVRYDPPNGQETFTGSTCVGSAAPIPNAPGGGGYAPLFLGAVGDIVIPRDGGTVNVSGARNVGPSMTSATGTVTATVTKKK